MPEQNIPVPQTEQNPANDELIQVSKEQLTALLDQNKELKQILASAVTVVGFVKENLFGGDFPTKVNVMAVSKIIMNLPKMVKNIDEEQISVLKTHFDIIKQGAKYLTGEQLKQIAKHE